MKFDPPNDLSANILSGGLAIGDRVRLSGQCRSRRFQPGETGRIVWVSRWGLSHVRLDRPRGVPIASFEPAELEPAV